MLIAFSEDSIGNSPALVAMKKGSRRGYLPDVSCDEGKWQQDTSLVLTVFERSEEVCKMVVVMREVGIKR